MPEHESKDGAFVPEPVGGGRRDYDRLRVDHLAHHAARGVGRPHQDRRKAQLLRRDLLQVAEQNVRCRVGTRERDAEPAEERAEEGIEHARAREGEAERGVEAGEAGERADREHRRDGDERIGADFERPSVFRDDPGGREAHDQARENGRDQHPRTGIGEPGE